MRDPSKSAALKKHSTGKAMVDSGGRVAPPADGPDFDNTKRVAGHTTKNMPDRDGPVKKQTGEGSPKKPPTSAKHKPMGKIKGVQPAPKRTSPDTGGQPMQAAMMPMPSVPMTPTQAPQPNIIAMRKSLGR